MVGGALTLGVPSLRPKEANVIAERAPEKYQQRHEVPEAAAREVIDRLGLPKHVYYSKGMLLATSPSGVRRNFRIRPFDFAKDPCNP